MTMMMRTGSNLLSALLAIFRIQSTTQSSPGTTGGWLRTHWATQLPGTPSIIHSTWSRLRLAMYTRQWLRSECSRLNWPNRERTVDRRTLTGICLTLWRENSASQLSSPVIRHSRWPERVTSQPKSLPPTCEARLWNGAPLNQLEVRELNGIMVTAFDTN